jgi:membrane-bound lytic murein transglycosylase D
MTKRFDSLLTRTFCVACGFILLLAGCASMPPLWQISPEPRDEIPSGTSVPEVALSPVDLPEYEMPPPVDLLSEPGDLFERVRRGFAMPELIDKRVTYHQQQYMKRPDYLQRMVERGSRYLHHIVEELEKNGMPMELALLPMIESAYNPMALSRSRASGLWQFIPSTGKHYKLDQDWWKDERRDVVASTAAALDYLQRVYDLHGDWHLALASYNWGENAVGRAIEKNRAQGRPSDYLSLILPAQTRNYVPKLQALKNIFRDPALMAELQLPPVPNQPYFATFTTDARIDVKLAAKLAEMPESEFVALNPAHKRPVILPDTSLVIPAQKLETFVSNLEAHGDEKKPLSVWQTYRPRPGEHLEQIATRFSTTVARLRSVNGIHGKARIRPGQPLLVPKTTGKAVASAPEVTRYTVRRGDTIYSIARQFKVTEEDLMRINGVSPKTLKAGATLTIRRSAG